MPSVQPKVLVDAILDAITESGETGLILSSIRTHPRKFAVLGPNGSLSLWIYAWTLTPGGRPQLKNEYRIQMTSVSSPLRSNPDGETILIGYEPNLKMFAGFDIGLHRVFSAGSPSVQINISSIHKALQDGLAFHKKDNNEVTVAIRPDHFMSYVRNSTSLHKAGKNVRTYRLLNRASSLEQISEDDINNLTQKRRRLVHTISRVTRDANFRQRVLTAYGHRCAVTRMQLRLVEAAHILPVAAPESLDHTRNGLALSPTNHRAFDSGLIYLDTNYIMRINPEKESELNRLNLNGGLTDFKSSLGKIHLPPDKSLWPHTRFILRANKYRGIS